MAEPCWGRFDKPIKQQWIRDPDPHEYTFVQWLLIWCEHYFLPSSRMRKVLHPIAKIVWGMNG